MNNGKTATKHTLARLAALLPFAAACSSVDAGGAGMLRVVVEAEDTITAGIAAGSGEEEIQDGWSVGFDKYIAVLGDIDIALGSDQAAGAEDARVFAVDLSRAPSEGFALWSFEQLEEGRYEFAYALATGQEATRHESVDPADFIRLVDEDLSYLIAGILQKSDGTSCPPRAFAAPGERVAVGKNDSGDDCYANPSIAFEIAVAAPTTFGPCQIDGLSGVVIAPDKTKTSTITIHGDHLFFNGFPENSEGGVVRRAQWLADSDLDLNGTVGEDELKALEPSDLETLAQVQLGGSPLAIDSVWTYLAAQLKTQGHYQGEGECVVDGAPSDHAHD